MTLDRPGQLRINAWDGDESPTFDFPATAGEPIAIVQYLAPRLLPQPWDWRSPDVGWGLVLRDDPTISQKDKAVGADAPEPIRRLLAARAPAPILRYQPGKPPGEFVRYYPDGDEEPLSSATPDRGTHEGQVPQYLLIYGSPSAIPWAVQYSLNLSAFVGRLDLTVEEGLEHYITALIEGWPDRGALDAGAPLVWSADWGQPDITFLLNRLVAERLSEAFRGDTDLVRHRWLSGRQATTVALGEELATTRPAFVCTTSHGMTGPFRDPAATVAHLGSPVDSLRKVVEPDHLRDWSPGGAIWYAHACCSAGSDRQSRYAELIGPQQRGGALLRQVADASGARIAPLPRMLLGAEQPLAAFVGHVEPTFDWTLRHPITKQPMTHTIIRCLYDRLFTPGATIGWALADIYAEVGSLWGLVQAPGETDNRETLDVYRKLAAIDRQNLVILGDPTVTLRTPAA